MDNADPFPDQELYSNHSTFGAPSTLFNNPTTQSLFHQYFPNTADVDSAQQIVELLVGFFTRNLDILDFHSIIDSGAVWLDFSDLYDTEEHREHIPVGDFPTTLRMNPESVLTPLAAAVHIATSFRNENMLHLSFPRLFVRIRGYPILTPIQSIGSSLVGQYVAVKGTITRVGTVQPLVVEIPFTCMTCNKVMVKPLPDGIYTLPTTCVATRGCRGRQFAPVYQDAYAIDWQLMILQEIVDADSVHAGRIPPLLDCELSRDLISTYSVGDHVQVSGIVKARRPDNTRYGKKNVYVLYLEVNAIHATTLLTAGSGALSTASASGMMMTMPSLFDKDSHEGNSLSHPNAAQSLLRQNTADSMIAGGASASQLTSALSILQHSSLSASMGGGTQNNLQATPTQLSIEGQQPPHGNDTSVSKSTQERNGLERLLDSVNPLFCRVYKLYLPLGMPPIMASGLTLTANDLSMIAYIHAQPQLPRLLVNSICPNIYGHVNVKLGMLLALLGGVHRDDDTGVTNRYNIHILLVGEPGLGKSQLLRSVSQLTERGVYISGQGSSGAGLTATLVKEGKGFTLEPGALVIGDRGVTCIDELDKLQHEHKSLLEAMEQQSISITKAGSICQLPARTTVIAAANPKGGTYDRSKSILENLKMSTALLSRFDLCYLMLDQGNRDYDQLLSEHVISLHTGEKSNFQNKLRQQQQQQQRSSSYPTQTSSLTYANSSTKQPLVTPPIPLSSTLTNPPSKQEVLEAFGHHIPLQQRYEVPSSAGSTSSHTGADHFDPLPPLLLKKYIAFAREHIKPILSPTARNIIEEYFISLRRRSLGVSSEHSAVTTRQLESLIRLCEARAKVEMRPISLSIDAYEVIEIMDNSMYRMFIDAHSVQTHQKTVGKKRGAGAMLRQFHDELITMGEQQHKDLFTLHEMKQLGQKLAIPPRQIMMIIDKLHNDCILLMKGNNTYKLTNG